MSKTGKWWFPGGQFIGLKECPGSKDPGGSLELSIHQGDGTVSIDAISDGHDCIEFTGYTKEEMIEVLEGAIEWLRGVKG